MIELEPLDSLALTLHHAPGVQALLLGSGISSAAGIPTGWAITLNLICRLANVQGIANEPDWAAWYQKQYSKKPSYSEILDALATTPSERQSIIRGYIEADGDAPPRQPSKTHHAIARLVALGAVRVILTTNFDRLLEKALRDQGIEPTIIASEDAAAGATPLVHSPCTVVKLHGDYLDSRIKNTADELDHYAPVIDGLLDRVLDEYGLVVAGWSGEWDTALRAAILRSKGHRYPFYWASKGELAEKGQDLLHHKDGRKIPIADADSFFSTLVSKVEALQTLHRAHPVSVAMTVAEGKRQCREARSAPDWSDLLAREFETFSDFIKGNDYPRENLTKENYNALVNDLVARSESLRRLTLVGVRWGCNEAFECVLRMIDALRFSGMDRGGLSGLKKLAAALCFQWAISAALLRSDNARATQIMCMPRRDAQEGVCIPIDNLPIFFARMDDTHSWKDLNGLENSYTPHSDFFSKFFAEEVRDIVIAPSQADPAWDESELLIALEYGYQRLAQSKAFWAPLGRFAWNKETMVMLQRFCELTPDNPILKAGLLGGTPATAKQTAEELAKLISQVRLYPH